MHLLDNYLDPLYKNRDIFDNLLRYYGAHQDLDTIHDELARDFTVTDFKGYQHLFESIFSKYYNTLSSNIETYTLSDRIRNIFSVNNTQYKKLQQNNHKVTYTVVGDRYKKSPSGENTLMFNKNIKIDYNLLPSFKHRCFTLYHRSGDGCMYSNNDDNHSFGVDIFQLIIIYMTVYSMIVDKKTKLFNDIKIVSRYNKLPAICFDLFKKNCTNNRESCLKQSSGDQFIIDTCFFSNTLHFWSGELPDSFCYNIPTVTYTSLLQADYMEVVHNKHLLPFVYYPGNVLSNGNIHVENNDKDYIMSGELHSLDQLVNMVTGRHLNVSIEKIIDETIKCVVSLENKLINNEIL